MNPVTLIVGAGVLFLLLNRQGQISGQSPLAQRTVAPVRTTGAPTQAGQTTQTLGLIASLSSAVAQITRGFTNSGFQSPSVQAIDLTGQENAPSVIPTQSIGIITPDVSPNFTLGGTVGLNNPMPDLFPDQTGVVPGVDLNAPIQTQAFDPTTLTPFV